MELVQSAEMLLHLKRTSLENLWEYALTRHLDGVVRARRVLHWVREKVESPMETLLRLMIVFARVVTSADLNSKREVVRRVHRAIVARGYRGRPPMFNDSWDRMFPTF